MRKLHEIATSLSRLAMTINRDSNGANAVTRAGSRVPCNTCDERTDVNANRLK